MKNVDYPIYLRLKIPFLTKLFNTLFWVCGVISFILFVVLLPHGQHSGGTIAYYQDGPKASNFEIRLLESAILGIPIFLILAGVRFKRKALLQLSSMNIIISNQKTVKYYPVSVIKYMYFNDATEKGISKEKLTIDFNDEDSNLVSITLIDYCQCDELIDALKNYDKIKFEVTDFIADPLG